MIFPITTTIISKDLSGDVKNVLTCPGALTLKRVLKKYYPNVDTNWGVRTGYYRTYEQDKSILVNSTHLMVTVKIGDVITFDIS